MLLILLLVILVLMFGLPYYPAAQNWGPAPNLLLFILGLALVLWLLFGNGGGLHLRC